MAFVPQYHHNTMVPPYHNNESGHSHLHCQCQIEATTLSRPWFARLVELTPRKRILSHQSFSTCVGMILRRLGTERPTNTRRPRTQHSSYLCLLSHFIVSLGMRGDIFIAIRSMLSYGSVAVVLERAKIVRGTSTRTFPVIAGRPFHLNLLRYRLR
jgi:hypothetical protein